MAPCVNKYNNDSNLLSYCCPPLLSLINTAVAGELKLKVTLEL